MTPAPISEWPGFLWAPTPREREQSGAAVVLLVLVKPTPSEVARALQIDLACSFAKLK